MIPNEKHGQGTHCTKVGADSLAKNTANPQNLFVQFVCPSPKVLDFHEKKASLGVHSPCLLLTAGHKSAITDHSAMAVQLVQL